MQLDSYLAFISIITLLLLSPGPSVLLAIKNGVNYGSKKAIFAILGNVLAFQVLILLSALGLGIVVQKFTELVLVIKIVGAGYLCFVGYKTITAEISAFDNQFDKLQLAQAQAMKLFKEAFLVTMSNPKALIFVSALLPQFIVTNDPLLLQIGVLCLISSVIHFAIYSGYALVADSSRRYLSNTTQRKRVNQLTGVVFIGFAVYLLI